MIFPNVCREIFILEAASCWYTPSRSARRIASSSSKVRFTCFNWRTGMPRGPKHPAFGVQLILLHLTGRGIACLSLLAYANNIARADFLVNMISEKKSKNELPDFPWPARWFHLGCQMAICADTCLKDGLLWAGHLPPSWPGWLLPAFTLRPEIA